MLHALQLRDAVILQCTQHGCAAKLASPMPLLGFVYKEVRVTRKPQAVHFVSAEGRLDCREVLGKKKVPTILECLFMNALKMPTWLHGCQGPPRRVYKYGPA